jgi:hypothetical protein
MSENLSPAVVIVGSERSGTNLLRALLSTHSKIASPPPAGIIDALGGIQSRYFPSGHPAHLSALIDDVVALTKTHLNPWNIDLDPKAIKARVINASLWDVFRVVNEIYAEECGRPCWCSKEPGLFNHIAQIAEHLPNAKFVYLVRDGRDVALSILRGHLHVFHVYFAAEYWAATQRYCMSALADPAYSARMHLVKYENLIANPERVLRDLMHFIGLEFESLQLQYYRDEKILDHSKRSRFWKNLASPIDGKNKGKYRDNLGMKNIEIFESVAWAEMEALGYPLDSAHKKTFTCLDTRFYRAIAFVRKQFWSMDPSAEGFRIRARVKARREIINRVLVP